MDLRKKHHYAYNQSLIKGKHFSMTSQTGSSRECSSIITTSG